MKKKSIGLIIGLMGFALLGVMGMQLYFLTQAYQLQSQLFDNRVSDAMKKVVERVDKHDEVQFFKNRAKYLDSQRKVVAHAVNIDLNSPDGEKRFVNRKVIIRDSLKKLRDRLIKELRADDSKGTLTVRRFVEKVVDEYGNVHEQQMVAIVNTPLELMQQKNMQQYDTAKYDYEDPILGRQSIIVKQKNPFWDADQLRKSREKKLVTIKKLLEQDSLEDAKSRAIFNDLTEEFQASKAPLKKRINPLLIDSLLRFELRNQGIELPFTYEVSTYTNDTLIFSNANNTSLAKAEFENDTKPYETRIFVRNEITDPGMLRLAFPAKSSLILGNMGASLGTSAGLLMILIFCFGYTIFSILKQKKISEMKTDFINNMTHEFKTPVSTIMIASEALKDSEVTADPKRITRLANMIYEENARLGSHIERVLNIAKIEKEDFKLDIKPVEVNDTIAAIVDSMQLKLQKYNADVTLQLDAQYSTVNADDLHFSNVIYNLIDNALKYSKESPQIKVATSLTRNTLVITVTDKGIGMSREEQARIFEQFYRIPTGNLHDVKGFGLGLSYVNTIVKRLDGTISVKSEKDKGSEFELRFPVV
ncbi:sensor histidine kinase [Mucilaginibacter myungsuensis]|uniref:histidine kinase n=1 Tax=Mucilaginibacter myungsuensis TaxID=649104 RepID=A0A929PXU3_9SPHI|nr:HAMP domain-containing sensor histidine kinase [Mucilaginibacter myungsuensis]MBE9663531.1 HAMP domain-containing histidine kinase [Mucilaginibacter myungsuensis]MDN3600269.1 HAMP domain-containing sensor histidine kinase [Mucilaginibacter myungsuensis]